MFLALSLFGYTTKRDLTGMGTFLFVGLIAVVLVSIVNVFIGSTMLQTLLSIVGIGVFAGLTAWDTQRLKSEYAYYGRSEAADKLAIMGALSLYLNLINMFQLLLNLVGERE
jgi:FtsH-binding integral membrane protein